MISQQGISRRHMIAVSAAGGVALVSGIGRATAQGATRIEKLAPELDAIVATDQPIVEIGRGFGGPLGPAEGPLWWREGGYLLFSDIHASKRMKYTPGQGITVFQEKTNMANGLTRDLQGRLPRLRARDPPRHPPGTRRQPYRDRQQLPGPPPQPAERRGGEVGRGDLLHRPVDQPAAARAVGPHPTPPHLFPAFTALPPISGRSRSSSTTR